MRDKVITGVSLFDIHYPHENKRAMKAVFDFIADMKPEILVLGGDQLNMESVSHWATNLLRQRENNRIVQTYDSFNSEVLKPLEKLSHWTEKVWIQGNHENWAEQYIDLHPELEGLIEPEGYLQIKKRGWKFIDLNRSYKVGKLAITHGLYVNEFHAKKTLMTWGESQCIFYGHKHDISAYSAVYRGGDGFPRMAQSCGCLCDMNPDYMKNRPNNWSHGFLYFTIRPDGKFTALVIPIINGVFSFGRKTYGIVK